MAFAYVVLLFLAALVVVEGTIIFSLVNRLLTQAKVEPITPFAAKAEGEEPVEMVPARRKLFSLRVAE